MKTLSHSSSLQNDPTGTASGSDAYNLTDSGAKNRLNSLIPPVGKQNLFRKFLASAKALAFALLIMFFAVNTFAQIRVQQPTGSTGGSAASSFSVTLAAPTNGNTLVAVISTRGTSTGRVNTITQTNVTTWTRAVQVANTNTGGCTTEIWYASVGASAGTTVTINLASSLYAAAVVMEYSGILTVSPLDVTATNTGNSSSESTGTTSSTTQDNELWIGAIGIPSSSNNAQLGSITNSFSSVANINTTNGTSGNNARIYALDKIVSTTGTASTGGTTNNSYQWSGAIATFKGIPPVTFTSTGTGGNWNTPATWDQNAVPTAGNHVVIATGAPVTLNVTTAVLKNLTINSQLDASNSAYSVTGSGIFTLANTGTLLVGGAFPSGFGTNTIDAASTVTFNGAGTQTIPALTYGNLTLSGAGAKTTAGTGTVNIFSNLDLNAGTTLNLAASVLNVTGTTSVSGTVNTTSGTGLKTFTGAVTVNSGGTWDLSGNNPATSFGGGITNNSTNALNNGTGAAAFSTDQSLLGTGNMTFGGSVTPASTYTLTNSNSGTVTVTGSIVLTGNFTQGLNSPTLVLSSATPFSGTGIFEAGTNANTVNYTGTAQAIRGANYYNLGFSGSGTKTAGSINIALGGTFTSTAPDIVFNGDYINTNPTLLNAGSATIEISGTATQSIAGFSTTGLVTMNKTGGVATLAGNMTNNGLTINGSGGTLNLGKDLTHIVNLAVTLTAGTLNGGNSTLIEQGGIITSWNGNGALFNANLSTVNFNNGLQTLSASATTFYNVIFEGGGTKTLSSTTAFNNITIATGTLANLGTALTHTAKTLTLGTTLKDDGSYGGTGCSNPLATIIPTSFAAASGVLNTQASVGAVRLKITNHNTGLGVTTLTAGTPQTIDITALNGAGDPFTGYLNTGTYTFSGASVAPTTPTPTSPTITDNAVTPVAVPFGTNTPNITFVNGVATVILTPYKAENNINIVVTDGTLTSSGADRLNVTAVSPGPLASLAFNTLVTPQASGTPFTGTNTLTAKDAWTNVATNFDASGNPVTISYTPVTTGTGTITGLGSANNAILNEASSFVSGVASLSGMVFTGTPGSYTFTATSTNAAIVTSAASSVVVINPATYYSKATGNWSSNTTWSTSIGGPSLPSGIYPQATDNVVLEPGFTVTVDANSSCASLTFDGTGTATAALAIPTSVILGVTGAVTANSCNTATGFNTASSVSGLGTLNCSSLQVGTDYATTTSGTRTTILTSTLSNFNVEGNLTVSSYVGSSSSRLINASFLISGGAVDVDGIISTTNENASNTSVFSMSGGTGTLLLSNASPFSLTGTGISTINLTGTSSTVNYDGSVQTVYPTAYTNLTLSVSGAKTMTGVTTINGNLTLSGSVTASTVATSVGGKIALSGSSQLTTGATLAVTGNVELTGTSTMTIGAALNVTGNLAVGDGTTFTVGAGALGITGTTTVGDGAIGTLVISSATGTKTFSGAVTINAGANFTESAAAQLAFGSNVTITGTLTENTNAVVGIVGSLTNNGIYTASTGVHTFTGSGKTIGGTTTNAIPSATFSGSYTNSGTLTDATALTVSGAFTNSGTINATTVLTVTTPGVLTNNGTITATAALSGSGTLTQGGAGILNIGGTSGISAINAGTASNTVNFTGADQTIPAFNYYNLTNTGSGTTTLASSGVIGIAGAFTKGGNTYITTGSTVSFNGTGAQVVPVLNYNNLTINKASEAATLEGAVSLPATGVLTLTSGNLITTSINSLTLTNTAVGAISGGSSTSYVDGPLVRSLPANLATGTNYSFPVGNLGHYYHFALVNPVTGTSATAATVQATNANAGGTPDGTLSGLSTNFYWSLAMNPSGGGFNSMVALTDPVNPTSYGIVASAPAVAGTYTSRGGVTSTGSTVTSTANIGSDTYFTLGNLPPHYVVTADNYSPVAGSTVTISAQLYDGNNTPWAQPGYVVQWTQTDASVTAPGTFGGVATTTSTTNSSGIATISFTTSTVAGRATQIIGTDATSPAPSPVPVAGTSPTITTVFGPEAQLVWGVQPSDAIVGAAISPSFTILIQDVNGNLTNSTSTVNIVKNTGGGPGTLSGTSAVASGGVATFSASSINAPGKYSLTATTSAFVSASSVQFTITPNAVSTLSTGSTISAAPTSIGANSTSTITMQAADAAGNLFTTGGLTVTFHTTLGTVGTTTDNGNGTYTATLTSGIVAGTAAVTFTIAGTAPDPAQNSVNVIFTPGPVASFVVAKSGGGDILGQVTTVAFPIQVTAYDANGNIATSFTGAASTVDITSTGTLSGGTFQSAAFTNGVLNPISVTINNVGNFTITATQHGGSINASSNSFSVVATGADRYSFANGDWNSTSTWAYSATATTGGADVPATGTPVHIVNGKTVTVSTSGAACGTLDFAANATGSNTLSIVSGGSLTTGVITVPNAGIGYANTLDGNAGNLTASSISFPYVESRGSQTMTISTGTVSVTGGVTTSTGGSTASVIFTGAGTLNVGGNFFNTGSAPFLGIGGDNDGIITTVPGSTINYNGAGAQSVKGGIVYSNLTLSNSGLKNFYNWVTGSAHGITVTGVLSLGGTATAVITSNGSITGATPTDLYYSAPSGTLQYNTTTARSGSTYEWPTPFVGPGGVIIANTGTITMPGNSVFNPGIPLTINNLATLSTGNNALTFGGDFINNGTFLPGSSGITLNGTVSQNIGTFSTAGTMTFAKASGTATLQGALVSGAFVLNGTGILNDNNYAITANGALTLSANTTLTLGGSVHQLRFADSHSVTWGGTMLTITGWQGNYSGGSGTAGQIFVGTSASGLTAAQLAKIRFFDGVNYFTAIILSTGEVVPAFNLYATNITTPPFCVVSTGTTAAGTVYYTSNNTYPSATYTAYLSDASGSFDTPVSIGTVSVTNPGTPNTLAGSFPVTIPAATPSGTGYTIRVDMTSPATVPGNQVTSAFTVVQGVSNVTSPTTDASVAGQTTLSWTNPTNCFQGVMIVAKAGSAVTSLPSGPVTNYAWTAGSLSFGTGTAFDGGFVVYEGTGSGSPVPTVYNLTGGTTYYYTFFTWNGSDWSSGITVNATPAGGLATFHAEYYFRTVANGPWTTSANWNESIDGVTWTSFPSGSNNYPTSLSAGIAVNHTVSVATDLTIDQTVVSATAEIDLTGGILTIADGTGTDLDVLGIFKNTDTTPIVTTGTVSFGSASSYLHAANGSAIPTATWTTGSTCNITGVTSTIPSGMGQSFSKLIWNNTGQTAAPTSGSGTGFTVGDTFTFANSGSGNYIWPAAACTVNKYVQTGGTDRLASTTVTHAISGNLSVSGGTLDLGRSTGSPTINVGGNVLITGGALDVTGSGTPILNIAGNLTVSAGGAITVSGSGTDAIHFVSNANTHIFTSGGTFSGRQSWNIDSGATVNFGTNELLNSTGTSTFSLASGGSIITANTGGLASTGTSGSIQVSGARNYNAGANYTYNGAAAQVTGTGLTGAANLTLNNSAGITLSAATAVSGTLTLSSGKLNTNGNLLTLNNTANTAISGGSDTRYIYGGAVKWTLPAISSSVTYNFPIGTATSYLPFSLVNPTTSGTSSAEVQAFEPAPAGTFDATLVSISGTEYWSLTTGTNFTNSSVSLTRPTALAPLDAIGGSATAGGQYATLGGSAGTSSVIGSNAIGTNRFFRFAGRLQTITTGTITSGTCAGTTVNVPYTIAGTFSAGNVFTAQLSDATGSFGTPTNIGTLTQTTAGTIIATIPIGLTGSGYKIRVISSAPVITSDPGSVFTFNVSPTITTAVPATATAVCYSASLQTTGLAYTATTGVPTAYSIDWDQTANDAGLPDQTPVSPYTVHSFSSGSGTMTGIVIPATLTGGTYNGLLKLYNGNSCSNELAISVTVYGTQVPPTASGEQSICYNSSPSTVLSATEATGGNGTYTYHWQQLIGSTWTDVASANDRTSFQPGALTTTTQFRISSTNDCGTAYSNAVTVTVLPLPQGSLSANGPFCGTGAGQLTWTATAGTGPYTVVYNDGTLNRTALSVVSGTPFDVYTTPVTGSTTYTLVSVTDQSSCVRSSGFTVASATITVHPLPQGSLTANGPFCATGPGQLTWTATAGTGPYTVVYNDGTADRTKTGAVSGTAFDVFTTPVTGTTTYTLVSVTDEAHSCVRSTGFTGGSATITVNPLPQGTLTNNGPFCATGAGQLTWTATAGTGPYTVIYSDGTANRTKTGVVSGTAFDVYTTPVTGTTTYTLVSVTDETTTCVRSTGFTGGSTTITVNPLPQGSLSANGPFCGTGAGQLTWTATAGTGPYTVIYNDGTANRTATDVVNGTPFNVFTTPVTGTTIYTLVSVTDQTTSCIRSSGFTAAAATITVHPLPQGTLTANGPFCATGNGQLTWTATAGTGPYTIVYNDGIADRTATSVASGVAFYVSPITVTATTTYTLVSVTDEAHSCIRSTGFTGGSAVITVNPLPQGSLTNNGPFCATGAGQLIWTATAGTGPYTVIYNDGTANRTVTDVVSGTAFGVFTTPVTGTTTYTLVSVTDQVKTCERSTGFTGASTTITINPLPTPVIEGSATACAGETGSVYQVTNTTGHTYNWSVTGGTISAGTGTNAITVSWGTGTAGTVDVTELVTATGCSADAPQRSVVISPLPAPAITGADAVCIGSSNVYSVPGVTGYTYEWTVVGGSVTAGGTINDNTVTITWGSGPTGTVNVIVTSANNCAVAAPQVTVTISPLPAPTITPSATSVYPLENVTYTTEPGMNSYVWIVSGTYVTDYAIISGGSTTDNTLTVQYKTPGVEQTVTVSYKNSNGCEVTTPASVKTFVNARNTLTIAAKPKTKIYGETLTGGVTTKVDVDYIVGGLAVGESITSVTIDYGPGGLSTAGAGKSALSITVSNAQGNFDISHYSGPINYVKADVTVDPKPITITASNVTRTYGDAPLPTGSSTSGFTYAPSPLPNGETISAVTFVYRAGNASNAAATTYNGVITASNPVGINTTNYRITNVDGNITVKKAPLTITALDVPKPYGTALTSGTFVAAGRVTAVGLKNGETFTYIRLEFANPGALATAPAADYPNAVTPSSPQGGTFSAGNYETPVIVKGTIHVGKVTLTYKADDKKKCYDGQPFSGPYTVTYGTFIPGEDASVLSGTLSFTGTAKTATQAGTYTITPGGLTSDKYELVPVSGTLLIGTVPSATVIASKSICAGEYVSLGAAAVTGSSYSWTSDPSGFSTPVANPSANPKVTTTYTLVETDNVSGCFNSHNVKITVNPMPAAIAGTDKRFCAGGSAIIGAPAVPGNTYSWTSSPTDAVFNKTSANPTVSPAVTTIYTLVETNTSGGCTNTKYVVVTVDPLPSAILSGNANICSGTSVNLSISLTGAQPWSITYTDGTNTIVKSGITSTPYVIPVSPTATTTYRLTAVSDANNCTGGSSTGTAIVNVSQSVVDAGPITGKQVICGGEQGVSYSIAAIPNAISYEWTAPVGATISTGDKTRTVTVNYSAGTSGGTISVYPKGGCNDGKPSSLAITVSQIPGAAGVITGSHTFIQGTNGVPYSVSPIANATNYVWNLTTGATVALGANTSSITVNFGIGATVGFFTVKGTNTCGEGALSAPFALEIPDAKFDIFPVPSNGIFTAAITFPSETTFNIIITNQRGSQIMHITDAKTVGGAYKKIIDLGSIPNGLYYVKFYNGTFMEVRKLLIQR